jgi:hypothetical protein
MPKQRWPDVKIRPLWISEFGELQTECESVGMTARSYSPTSLNSPGMSGRVFFDARSGASDFGEFTPPTRMRMRAASAGRASVPEQLAHT